MKNVNEREVEERRKLTEQVQRVEELIDIEVVELDEVRDLFG